MVMVTNANFKKNDQEQHTDFPALEKLSKSSNRNLRNASAYALWQIEGSRQEGVPRRESLPHGPPPTFSESTEKPEQATPSTIRLMISYQWDSKPIARKIRDGLVDRGYTAVWMDDTHMSKASKYMYITLLQINVLKID